MRGYVMSKFNQDTFKDETIPRPEHWGGYTVSANRYEFWQGGGDRLHDRICFEHDKNNEWARYRLAP